MWFDLLGALSFSQRLLIWDSHRCHVCRDVDKVRQKFKNHSAVIPRGRTSYIQAPDVLWNKMFKSSLREQYDYWLEHGEKSFTAAGNMRAVSKSVLCDMVVRAWESLTPDLIKRSFECCGQVPEASAQNIDSRMAISYKKAGRSENASMLNLTQVPFNAMKNRS